MSMKVNFYNKRFQNIISLPITPDLDWRAMIDSLNLRDRDIQGWEFLESGKSTRAYNRFTIG